MEYYSSEHCSAIRWSEMQYCALHCNFVQCYEVQYIFMQYSTVQVDAVQCRTVQCHTVQWLWRWSPTMRRAPVQKLLSAHCTLRFTGMQCTAPNKDDCSALLCLEIPRMPSWFTHCSQLVIRAKHSPVTVMLLSYYSPVTVLLQSCYCPITVLLQSCYSHVTVLLQSCYSPVTFNLQSCYIVSFAILGIQYSTRSLNSTLIQNAQCKLRNAQCLPHTLLHFILPCTALHTKFCTRHNNLYIVHYTFLRAHSTWPLSCENHCSLLDHVQQRKQKQTSAGI